MLHAGSRHTAFPTKDAASSCWTSSSRGGGRKGGQKRHGPPEQLRFQKQRSQAPAQQHACLRIPLQSGADRRRFDHDPRNPRCQASWECQCRRQPPPLHSGTDALATEPRGQRRLQAARRICHSMHLQGGYCSRQPDQTRRPRLGIKGTLCRGRRNCWSTRYPCVDVSTARWCCSG